MPKRRQRPRLSLEPLEDRSLLAAVGDAVAIDQIGPVENHSATTDGASNIAMPFDAFTTTMFQVDVDLGFSGGAAHGSLSTESHQPHNLNAEGESTIAAFSMVSDSALSTESCVVLLEGIPVSHNSENPTDVDNSGSTDAADALAVIEALRAGRDGEVLSESATPLASYDVTGDGHISPNDALQVINKLMADAQESQAKQRARQLAKDYVVANELDWGMPTGVSRYEFGSSERRIGRYIVGFRSPPEAQLTTDLERALFVWPATGEIQSVPTA